MAGEKGITYESIPLLEKLGGLHAGFIIFLHICMDALVAREGRI